jgi:hypothetical protein
MRRKGGSGGEKAAYPAVMGGVIRGDQLAGGFAAIRPASLILIEKRFSPNKYQ